MQLLSFKLISAAIESAFKRFPIVFIISIIGVIIQMYLIENPTAYEDEQFAFKLLQICLLGLPLFLSINLYAESAKASDIRKYEIQVAATVLLLLYWFLLPKTLGQIQYIRFFLWLVAFHLLVAFAPYIQRKSVNGFWQYNQKLFLRILISILYSGVLFIGMSVALLAIDQLFKAGIDDNAYAHLWVFMIGIFNTWFFLSGIPQDFDSLDEEHRYPKGLKIFTQYVLLPLVTVYLSILYVYTFKIIIDWDLPQGWVSYLVIIFSTVGIFSLLLIYPVRNHEGNKWIKIYSKGFYFALFPLIIMLFVAISKRLSAYGFTENRYFVILIALWLAGIALYFLVSKSKSIKAIPISLFLIVFLSSFGFWGAFSIAENSQFARLKLILTEKKLLKNGKVAHTKKQVRFSQRERQNIESIISFFEDRNRLVALQPLFKQNLKRVLNKRTYQNTSKLLAIIMNKDVSEVQTYTTPTYFEKEYENSLLMDIKNYDYLQAVILSNQQEKISLNMYEKVYFLNPKFEQASIQVLNDKEKILFTLDLNPLLEKLFKMYEDNSHKIPTEQLIFTQERSGKYRVKLQVEKLSANKESEDAFSIESLEANIFLRIEED